MKVRENENTRHAGHREAGLGTIRQGRVGHQGAVPLPPGLVKESGWSHWALISQLRSRLPKNLMRYYIVTHLMEHWEQNKSCINLSCSDDDDVSLASPDSLT